METATTSFKRPLSLSSTSSTPLENYRLLSASESSLESLNEEPYMCDNSNENKIKKVTKKKKKVKRSTTPNKNLDLDENLNSVKEKIEASANAFPLNYINFKSFLDKAFTNTETIEIALEYSNNIIDIADMMRVLYKDIKSKGMRSRFTKIIKKIELSVYNTESSNIITTPPS